MKIECFLKELGSDWTTRQITFSVVAALLASCWLQNCVNHLKIDPFTAEQVDARKHTCNARNDEVQAITQSLQRTDKQIKKRS